MSANNSTFSDSMGVRSMLSFTHLEQVSAFPAAFEKMSYILAMAIPYLLSSFTMVMDFIQSNSQYLSWSNVLNVVLVGFLVLNFKALPLVYHLRILNAIRHMLKCMRPTNPITPEQLFQPLITSSASPLLEVDVYGHKNNNTYFTDHDIARTHLLSTLFAQGIEKIRGSVTMNGLSGKRTSSFTIPLGAVSCSFRRELKPYEAYDMWTRILSWDEKWLYVVTHFVKKGAKMEPEEMALYPRQNSVSGRSDSSRQDSTVSLSTPRGSVDGRNLSTGYGAIAASAMSKVVFKDGRITIAPEVMLEASNLLPPKPSIKHRDELVTAQLRANTADTEVSSLDATHEVGKLQDIDACCDSRSDSSGPNEADKVPKLPTRKEIEAERIRGLRLAKMLAGQVDLEHELRNDIALGRHSDGNGIPGIIATLLQLGKLSNYQLL